MVNNPDVLYAVLGLLAGAVAFLLVMFVYLNRRVNFLTENTDRLMAEAILLQENIRDLRGSRLIPTVTLATGPNSPMVSGVTGPGHYD